MKNISRIFNVKSVEEFPLLARVQHEAIEFTAS